jgi:hypothetical protein
MKNIYNTLGTGKALIIAHKGVDCSICRSQAPALQTWASQNSQQVEVWGAMSWTYSPNAFTPECQKTLAWKNQYAWNDIFTFADSVRDWAINQSPIYYVYSAIDSTIVYQGSSRVTAQNTAISQSVVGLNSFFLSNQIKLNYLDNTLYLSEIPTEVSSIRLLDVQGRMLLEERANNTMQVELNETTKGLIIVQFIGNKDRLLGSKKLMTY